MPVRKPSLAEWFYIHVHDALWRDGFYVPGAMTADVTHLVDHFADTKPPLTAIVIRALALTAARHPVVNRLVVSTWWGYRYYQPTGVHVGVPALGRQDDKSFSHLLSIRDANQKSVAEIARFLAAARRMTLAELPVSLWLSKRKNTFLNRCLVRLGLALALRTPALLDRVGASAVAVSSLLALQRPGFVGVASAASPAGLSVTVASLEKRGERSILHLGMCFNHKVCRGDEAFVASQDLSSLLSDPTQLAVLLGE